MKVYLSRPIYAKGQVLRRSGPVLLSVIKTTLILPHHYHFCNTSGYARSSYLFHRLYDWEQVYKKEGNGSSLSAVWDEPIMRFK